MQHSGSQRIPGGLFAPSKKVLSLTSGRDDRVHIRQKAIPCHRRSLLYPVLVSPQYIESLLLIPEFDPLENVLIFAIENGCHKLGMPSHLYQLVRWRGSEWRLNDILVLSLQFLRH
jgi:hypothetical protein